MIQAPTSLREMLRLFAHYSPDAGLDALFAQVDWSGVSARQVSHAFLDRPPLSVSPEPFDAAAEARRLFESEEFRRDLLRRTITAFPNRQRILFVHLPKCAGTDFEASMRDRHPSLYESLSWNGRFGADETARALHQYVRQFPGTNTTFVGGHTKLGWYIDNELYRYSDRIVTIVRHPREIAISFANYVLQCMIQDPNFRSSDTRGWGSTIGLDRFDPSATPAEKKQLARKLVTAEGILPVNPMCALLGEGTAASALRNLGRVDIEITHVAQYTAWLRERWGIERSFRANAAPRVVSAADLSPAEKATIAAACTEDMQIYTAVTTEMEACGGLSVTGPQVARA